MNLSQQTLMQMLHNKMYGLRQLNASEISLLTLYLVIALLSLGGNGLFLFLSFRYRGLRRHISYIMMSLAGSNLLVTCTCLPVSAVRLFYTPWHLGEVGCRLVTFIEGLSLSVNSFSLASIAILRARQSALMIPPTQTSNRGLRLLVTGTWLGSIIVALPALFAVKLKEAPVMLDNFTGPALLLCSEDRSDQAGQKVYSAYFLLLLFLSPCIVLSFSYGFTARFISRQFTRLTKNPRARGSGGGLELPMATNQTSVVGGGTVAAARPGGGNGGGGGHSGNLLPARSPAYQTRKLQKRTVKTVVVLVALFFCCWFPKDCIILLQDFVVANESDAMRFLLAVYPYSQALIYMHSAVCPFLYWSLSRVFQHYVRKAFSKPSCCC